MGGKNTKTDDMPSDLKSKAIQLFKAIDTDCSGTIDYKEVLKFWGNNFAIINAQNLFQSVDKDDSKSIELCEWIEFWFNVLKSGHKKEDIIAEVRFIKNNYFNSSILYYMEDHGLNLKM